MKNKQLIFNTFFAVICAVLFNKPIFAEPTNLQLLREQVKVYHDSGTYQQELNNVIKQAHEFALKRANENIKHNQPEKLAIVLDIDETSLSNYDHMVKHEFVESMQQIYQDHLVADAPAIEPMLAFYNDAIKLGINVFFVTGRKENERKATAENLNNAGYHDWSGLYLKPENYTQKSAVPFKKETREVISKQGYTIIESIGDQDSDLQGGYAERTYKLPNPYYFIP